MLREPRTTSTVIVLGCRGHTAPDRHDPFIGLWDAGGCDVARFKHDADLQRLGRLRFSTALTASSLPLRADVVRLHHLERCAQKPGPIAGSKLFTRDACRKLYHFCNIVGSIRSPLLANIFLHEVLDEWYVRDVRPRMRGRTFLIRFADDFVIGCEREDDARRLMAVLPNAFCAASVLTIHPTKTVPGSVQEAGLPCGVRHWERHIRVSRIDPLLDEVAPGFVGDQAENGEQTLTAGELALWQWCRDQRHTPLKVQHRLLCQKLRGHYPVLCPRGNYPRLKELYEQRGARLAVLAESPQPSERHSMGEI